MVIDLLLIASIVMMVFESGWWDSIDDWINRKFRFCHLPHIFKCQFCQCFWLSLGWLFITYEISLLSVFLALITANVGEVLLPLFKLIKGTIMSVIEWFITKIY